MKLNISWILLWCIKSFDFTAQSLNLNTQGMCQLKLSINLFDRACGKLNMPHFHINSFLKFTIHCVKRWREGILVRAKFGRFFIFSYGLLALWTDLPSALVQPKHILTGRDELLGLIKEKECGLPVEDIKDAYPSVLEDLQVQYFESLLNYANQFCDWTDMNSSHSNIKKPISLVCEGMVF